MSKLIDSLPIEEMADLYNMGASYYYLAEEYGVSRETIRLALKKAGVKIRDASYVYVPEQELIQEYLDGVPIEELKAKYLITSKRLKSILRGYGL